MELVLVSLGPLQVAAALGLVLLGVAEVAVLVAVLVVMRVGTVVGAASVLGAC